MMHTENIILKDCLSTIESSREIIVSRWMDTTDVKRILLSCNLDLERFRVDYADRVMGYFLDVIRGEQTIGRCPAIENLLVLLQANDITTSELYLICIHFRESIMTELIRLNLLSETLYHAVCHLFDANFEGVLRMYTDTIFKAKEEKNEFQSLVENSLNEIYIFDTDTLRFSYVNRGAVINSGYSVDELKNMIPLDLKPYFVMEKFMELIAPLLEHKQERLVFETVHRRKDGSIYNVDIRLQLMNFASKESFVAIINDITERTQAVEERETYYEMATHDYLTNLYNRHKFDVLFADEVKRAKRYNHPVSLILFDIDDFKAINDTFGHIIGDTVLKILTKTAKTCLRSSDIFARWGGEEFIILLPHTGVNSAIQKAEELRHIFASQSIETAGTVTCSFGVAQVNNYDNMNQAFKDADDALYAAKTAGKNRVNACFELL